MVLMSAMLLVSHFGKGFKNTPPKSGFIKKKFFSLIVSFRSQTGVFRSVKQRIKVILIETIWRWHQTGYHPMHCDSSHAVTTDLSVVVVVVRSVVITSGLLSVARSFLSSISHEACSLKQMFYKALFEASTKLRVNQWDRGIRKEGRTEEQLYMQLY